jgi:tetratricopeptide (TPR) repeat protein
VALATLAEEAAAYRRAGLPLAALHVLGARGGTAADEASERAAALLVLGRLDEAVGTLEEAVGSAPSQGAPDRLLGRAWARLSSAYFRAGRMDAALDAAERALALTRADDRRERARVHLHRSRIHLALHAWPRAAAAAREAFSASAGAMEPAHAVRGMLGLGAALLGAGAVERGRRALEAAVRRAEAWELPWLAPAGHVALARSHLGDRCGPAAQRHLEAALDAFWAACGLWERDQLGHLSRLMGDVFLAAGQREEALHAFNRAVAYLAMAGHEADGREAGRRLAGCLAAPPPPWLGVGDAVRHKARRTTALLTLVDSLASLRPDLERYTAVLARYCRGFARLLGLPPAQATVLAFAARLCELGRTLERSSAADDARHPEAGEALLAPLPLPAGVARAVRHHHERWDGRGYPDGLAGSSIPLASRALAVVDAYVSRAWSVAEHPGAHSAAIAHLRAEAGRAFDPDLVAAFCGWHAAAEATAPAGAIP